MKRIRACLKSHHDVFLCLVSMAQGKHRVENGVAKRNLENIAFVGPNRPEKREERPLADLRAAITQEVQRQAQR